MVEVVVAPLQEIRLTASASANAKLARAGAEEQARQMALVLPTTEEGFPAKPSGAQRARFDSASRPKTVTTRFSEETDRDAPLRMTASSNAARSARLTTVSGKLREDGHGALPGARGGSELVPGLLSTKTVSVGEPGTAVGAGATQRNPGARPAQLNVTGPVNASVAVSETSKSAELPTLMVEAGGVMVALSSATEICAATLWLRPALVPVMVKEFGVVLGATVSPTSRVIVAEAPEAVGVTGGGARQLTPAGIELHPSATG